MPGVLSFGETIGEQAEKWQKANSDAHHTFAIRLMQHMVVPTFVLDAERKVMIWNHAQNG